MRYAVLAYIAWGLFPIYWKWLGAVPAIEVLCHRVGWSLLFYSGLLIWRREGLAGAFRMPRRIWIRMTLSAMLLAVNWFLYIWSVNNGRIIEASLGYFINPLFNVALGVGLLREKLTYARWAALTLAFAGVVWLSIQTGEPPWIALILGSTFSVYGLIRKVTPVDPLRGSQMESMMMIFPITAFSLISGTPFHWPDYSGIDWGLLAATGPVTGLPLVWFAEAAQIVPLNLMGFIQYLSPTLQFLIGLLAFSEPFSRGQLEGFACIWAALLIFVFDLWNSQRKL